MSMPADPHLPSLATGTLRQVTVNARRNEKTAPQARAARHLRPLVQHCLSRFCLHPCFRPHHQTRNELSKPENMSLPAASSSHNGGVLTESSLTHHAQ